MIGNTLDLTARGLWLSVTDWAKPYIRHHDSELSDPFLKRNLQVILCISRVHVFGQGLLFLNTYMI